MTETTLRDTSEALPRWSVADVHDSFESRSFVDAMEQVGADSSRLIALFDEHGIRKCDARDVTDAECPNHGHSGESFYNRATFFCLKHLHTSRCLGELQARRHP